MTNNHSQHTRWIIKSVIQNGKKQVRLFLECEDPGCIKGIECLVDIDELEMAGMLDAVE